MNPTTARIIAARASHKRTVAAQKAHAKPSLEQVGRSQPHAFFVHHEGKHKKNPHYVPARKRK